MELATLLNCDFTIPSYLNKNDFFIKIWLSKQHITFWNLYNRNYVVFVLHNVFFFSTPPFFPCWCQAPIIHWSFLLYIVIAATVFFFFFTKHCLCSFNWYLGGFQSPAATGSVVDIPEPVSIPAQAVLHHDLNSSEYSVYQTYRYERVFLLLSHINLKLYEMYLCVESEIEIFFYFSIQSYIFSGFMYWNFLTIDLFLGSYFLFHSPISILVHNCCLYIAVFLCIRMSSQWI